MLYFLLQADATLFFGRFHSLIVHLPIGFILLAAILFALSFVKKFHFLAKSLPLVLSFSAITAIISVILGFLLATEGGYPDGSLFWHRLMGIAVAILSILSILLILGYFDKRNSGKSLQSRLDIPFIESEIQGQKKMLGLILGASVISVSITGHLGGNLTHGEGYLFAYAPELVQNIFLDEELDADLYEFPQDPDSTLIFDHIIQPILIQKCASCHDAETQKGGLQVSSLEHLIEGGETGPALEEGAPESSELYKRVTMDPKSMKYMPPKGAGLSYNEITLLKYWIENGISRELAVTNEEIPEEVKGYLETAYGLSTRKKSHYEKAQVAAAPEDVLDGIRKLGYRISTLSDENNFLDVVALKKISKEDLEALSQIKEQITWLDLGEAGVEDAWMDMIASFPNLTRLLLDNNPLTDKGAVSLAKLEHLESINLYNTEVGDSTLNSLASIPSLQRAYLWKTKVSKELAGKLAEENSVLKVDLGFMEEEKESK